MKRMTLIAGLILSSVLAGACKKENEVPERREGYLREYIEPQPDFLTQSERELVEQKRSEYADFLNTANN